MIFALNRKASHAVLNLASSPGFVAAAQFASRQYHKKPRLQRAQVWASTLGVTERLDLVLKQTRLKRVPLRLLLEPSEYQLLQTDFPVVPAEELRTAIRWQVKDMLRAPMDKVTIDVAPPVEDAHGVRRPQGYVVAAENELVLKRMLQFRAYNASVEVIDIPEMAQRNFADLVEEPGRGTAILSVSNNGCTLTASRDGVLYFTRAFDLTLSSLAAGESARRDQFDRVVLELQRSIDVLEHQFSALAISSLWLAPFAYADELLSQLIDNLYIPVKLMVLEDLFDCSSCPLPAHLDHQAALFHALGLALRGTERVA